VASAETAHFLRTYDEAFDLLVEARNYMAYHRSLPGASGGSYPAGHPPGRPRLVGGDTALHSTGPSALPPDDAGRRLRNSCESMRITCRLTQVMAWLLAQRAVFAGEIEFDLEVAEFYALSAEGVCLENPLEDMEDIPGGLRSLLERSYQLYVRIKRLDEMSRRHLASSAAVGQTQTGRPMGHPV
jgi:regulator of CtrA degradation